MHATDHRLGLLLPQNIFHDMFVPFVSLNVPGILGPLGALLGALLGAPLVDTDEVSDETDEPLEECLVTVQSALPQRPEDGPHPDPSVVQLGFFFPNTSSMTYPSLLYLSTFLGFLDHLALSLA